MRKYGVLALALISMTSSAREKTVNSSESFNDVLRSSPLVVTFFYTSQYDRKTEREYGSEMKDARRVFTRVSKVKRYEDGGVTFVPVDIGKKDLASLGKRYGVTRVPVYMTFFRGQNLKTTQGLLVKRTTFLDEDGLTSLVERSFGKKLNSYFKERARLRQREREESGNRWSPYFYWGYPYSYPWGYPYYPYGGASFGFSVGI